MGDVDGVYSIAPICASAESMRTGRQFVQAATDAGVRQTVLSSVFHPMINALGNHIQKVLVEEAVIESGVQFAILNPGALLPSFSPM